MRIPNVPFSAKRLTASLSDRTTRFRLRPKFHYTVLLYWTDMKFCDFKEHSALRIVIIWQNQTKVATIKSS